MKIRQTERQDFLINSHSHILLRVKSFCSKFFLKLIKLELVSTLHVGKESGRCFLRKTDEVYNLL